MLYLRTALLVAYLLMTGPEAVATSGAIAGCVSDKGGGTLPGVQVVVAGPTATRHTTTDPTGCYRVEDLPSGSYKVTAALPGFVTAVRDSVRVMDNQTSDRVNFALCLGPLSMIDWVRPLDLEDMWRSSDVVAHVRIAGTGPVLSDCPTRDVQHTATVLEVYKSKKANPLGQAVSFVQETWEHERVPYPVGQEMVAFLVTTASGQSHRLCGPSCIFLLNGDKVTGFHPPIRITDMTRAEFVAKLRELARGRDGA